MTFSGAEPTKLNPLCYVLISAPENVTAPANVTILRRPSTLKSILQPETNRLALKWGRGALSFLTESKKKQFFFLTAPLMLTILRKS